MHTYKQSIPHQSDSTQEGHPRIWLSAPHMGGREQHFINEAFKENYIAPVGTNLTEFEKDLEAFVDAQYVVALSSGTAAIHLALNALKVQIDDFVLVQSFTFCASVNPIKYVGATPVFIDSERDTWNMSPEAVLEAIEHFKKLDLLHRVKAIIPVHLFGMPSKMDAILQIANEYGIPVLEDAAESLGSTINGKQTGTFGDYGVYSFNGNKIITTSGGGALVTHNEQQANLVRKLSTQARDEAPHYEHTLIGFNYRLSNVSAGIGRGQMEVLPLRIQQRRRIFFQYRALFEIINEKGYRVSFQEEPDGFFSNRWTTAILMKPEENKGKSVEELRLYLDGLNIESRPLWKPMHLQPVYQGSLHFGESVCEEFFETGLLLPSGSNMTQEEWNRIEGALTAFFTA